MKSFFILIFYFLSFILYAQDLKKYTFDYYSLYDLKTDTTSLYKYKYLIGNSKDSSYVLSFISNHTKQIIEISLYDFTNNKYYKFESKNRKLDSIKSFSDITKSYSVHKYNFSGLKSIKKDYMNIEYETINDETKIILKFYKDKKKKRLKYISYLHTKEFSFVKNQFYITDIVFAFKVDLDKIKTTGVLTRHSIVNEDSKTISYRELIEVNTLDFSLELKTELSK